MQLQAQNFTLAQNFDLSFDGNFVNGDKTPTLSWNLNSLISLVNQPAGTPVSFNAQALLQGTGSTLAVISLSPVTTGGTAGWAVQPDGDTVLNATPAAGSGQFALVATYLGLVVTSAPINWGFIAVSQTGAIKYHQGRYPYFDTDHASAALPLLRSAASTYTSNPGVAGFQVYGGWNEYEGPTKGDYTRLHTLMEGANGIMPTLRACKTPKRLALCNWDRSFGNSPTPAASGKTNAPLPEYMVTANQFLNAPAGTIWSSGGLGGIADYNQTAVWDQLIALSIEVGTHWDPDPLFECWCPMGESIYGAAPINPATYFAQLQRLMTTLSPHFPSTLLRLQLNYLNNIPGGLTAPQQMDKLIDLAISLGNWALGGPDLGNASKSSSLNDSTHFTAVLQGFDGTTAHVANTYANRVGKVAVWAEIEEDGQGAQNVIFNALPTSTAAQRQVVCQQAESFVKNTLGGDHFSIDFETWLTITTPDWVTWLNANPVFSTHVPSVGHWNTG